MDYERKYKEALNKAKAAYGTGAYDDQTLEAIFPELSESEDTEYIRKEALLEWAKQKQYDSETIVQDDFWQEVIDKLNSM